MIRIAKHIRHAATAFCMLALSPLLMPASGQSFEEGSSAYRAGDYATACVVHTLRVEGEATRRSVCILRGDATKYTVKYEGVKLTYWESGKHRSAIYIRKNPTAFSSLAAAKVFVESNRT